MSTAAHTAVSPAASAPAPSNVEGAVEAYLATWNETDAARRQAAVARAWEADGRYRDPLMASEGHAGIDAMLAGVQARFPGFVIQRTSKIDAHNDWARFAWSLGPAAGPAVVEGVDFCALSPAGRLVSVVGFIDRM
jgi:SnoaL-like domain